MDLFCNDCPDMVKPPTHNHNVNLQHVTPQQNKQFRRNLRQQRNLRRQDFERDTIFVPYRSGQIFNRV